MSGLASPRDVAALLGRRAPSLRTVKTLAELEGAVERGLPPAAVDGVVEAAVPEDRQDVARWLRNALVHPSMQKRKLARLPMEPSARVERVARVIVATRASVGEADTARRFLTSPHPMLRGRTPLQAALTELGARQVEQILSSSTAGLPL